MNQNTIHAIITVQGGAIGSIRVSDPEAIIITSRIFTPVKPGKLLSEQKPYTLTFDRIYNGEELTDEVLVNLFRASHSYTGGDSTEITCRGSPHALQQVVQLLIKSRCRTAQPGEYTQRASLNGKMDLSQAEAVVDLIALSFAATHRLALSQMHGGFSKELAALHEKPLSFASIIELELDLSEEGVEFADRSASRQLADGIEKVIARLVDSFSAGNTVKNGVPVATIGETNTGKSTLLNVLLSGDKAIVGGIHGTTCGVIEDTINIDGIISRFIDTVGIRETNDMIESLGIERTFQKLDQAEIVLWIIDSADAISQLKLPSDKILPRCEYKQLILVLNKVELIDETQKNELTSQLFEHVDSEIESIFTSAKQCQHMGELQQKLVATAHLSTVTQNDVIVTNVRHYEALTRALDAIRRV